MNDFIKNLVYNGELFSISRNNKHIVNYRALWETPLSSGRIHLVFFGEDDLQTSDVLTGETGNKFIVIDTFTESVSSKPLKCHVFCETEIDYNNRKHDKKIQEIKYWIPVVASNVIALAALVVTVITSIN